MDFYINGRNFSYKEELIPSLAVSKKLESIERPKKINISELFVNSDQQNLESLTSRLQLLGEYNNEHKEFYNYYSDWSYATTIISMIALAITILLLSLSIKEYQRELNKQDEETDSEQCSKMYYIANTTPTKAQEILVTTEDLKESYRRAPLYENQLLRLTTNPIFNDTLRVENWSTTGNELDQNNPVYMDMLIEDSE